MSTSAGAAPFFGEPELLLGRDALNRFTAASAVVQGPDGRQTVAFHRWASLYVVTRGRPGSLQRLGPVERARSPVASPVALAAGADGTRLVVWITDDDSSQVYFAVAPPGERFGGRVAAGDGYGFDAAIADDGTLVVGWTHAGKLRVRVGTLGGGFGAVQEFAAGGYAQLRLRSTPDGRMVVTWNGARNRRLAILEAGAARFGPGEEVPGADIQTIPDAIGLPGGELLVPIGLDSVQRRLTDGTWLAVEKLGANDSAAALAVRDGARAPAEVHLGINPVISSLAWPSGARMALQAFTGEEFENAAAPFLIWSAARTRFDDNWLRGKVVLSGARTIWTPGASPDTVTAFAGYDGRLYAIDHPPGPDRRPPHVTILGPIAGNTTTGHTAFAGGYVDEASETTITAELRIAGRWRRVARRNARSARPLVYTYVDFTPRRCPRPKIRARITLHATDLAGKQARTRRTQRIACNERHPE